MYGRWGWSSVWKEQRRTPGFYPKERGVGGRAEVQLSHALQAWEGHTGASAGSWADSLDRGKRRQLEGQM